MSCTESCCVLLRQTNKVLLSFYGVRHHDKTIVIIRDFLGGK